ncbi:MAG: MBL fold metallo-hydrolase [Eubacteriales bacterium]|nr:MBL fold metallo-hydrolase [Eubacteriales bacterium]
MEINFYRNCTMKIRYGGKTFLVDPMFRGKGVTHKLATVLYPEKGPLTDLPVSKEEIMEGVDAILLTHLHPGHFDQEAADCIPKDIPFFVQNLNDKDLSRKYGMNKKQTINMTLMTHLDDIDIFRVSVRHGDGPIQHVLNTMQNSSGIVLRKKGEKTLFITGDTVYCSGLEAGFGYNPDVIIAYLGHAYGENMHLTMGCEDLEKVHTAAPKAKLVAVHMETFENQELTRREVKAYAEARGFRDSLLVPENGETLHF